MIKSYPFPNKIQGVLCTPPSSLFRGTKLRGLPLEGFPLEWGSITGEGNYIIRPFPNSQIKSSRKYFATTPSPLLNDSDYDNLLRAHNVTSIALYLVPGTCAKCKVRILPAD